MFVYDRSMPATSAPSASEFLALDVASLSDAAVRESFLEARAQADQWELVCARLAAAVHERGIPNEDGATTTPTWIQQHAGQHRGEAKQSVRVGTSLPEFPEVESAWRAGTISASAARTIVSGRCPGAEAEYAALQPLLLSFAEQRQYRTLRQAIIYYQRCARHDRPPHEPAGVFLQRVGDMWSLHGTLDALSGEYLASALAAAQHAPTLDDLRSPAERRAEALGLGESLRVLPFVPLEQLPALMAGAEVFGFPSRIEGFGFPPLEAMACGTPVVSTTGGSLAEVLGEAALTVEPGDVVGFAAALRRVLDEPALRESLRMAGLARAATFTWARTAEATVAAYRLAAAGART